MKISKYKTEGARKFAEDWIDRIISESTLLYEKLNIETSFGSTRVLTVNHQNKALKPLIYVPGARTCGAFLALSGALGELSRAHRIYLLDVVGQVGLSGGTCPNIKDKSYGVWLDEVCLRLEIETGVFVGASFGGEIIIKLAAAAPERIERAILMNPIGFAYINLSPKSLFYTLAPLVFPSERAVENFLARVVFTDRDGISASHKKRVADFTLNAIKNFKFGGAYPIRLPDWEIKQLTAETHLFLGERDGLIAFKKTAARAKTLLPDLRSVKTFPDIGHGIEISSQAVIEIRRTLQDL